VQVFAQNYMPSATYGKDWFQMQNFRGGRTAYQLQKR
jgi:hypothetical protein